MLPTPIFLSVPAGSAGKKKKKKKKFACNLGALGLIAGLRRSSGEGNSYPLQYSGLENSMDCIVHGFAELDTTERLSLSFFLQGHRLFNGIFGIPESRILSCLQWWLPHILTFIHSFNSLFFIQLTFIHSTHV